MGNYILNCTKKRIIRTIQTLLEAEGKAPWSSSPVRDDILELWLGQYWIVRELAYRNKKEHLFVMRYHIADGCVQSGRTRVRVVYNGRIVFEDDVDQLSEYGAAVRGPWRLRLEALAEGNA